jgi:hypothetical protein
MKRVVGLADANLSIIVLRLASGIMKPSRMKPHPPSLRWSWFKDG